MYRKLLIVILLIELVSYVKSNDINLGFVSVYSRKIYSEIKKANPALWIRTDDVLIDVPLQYQVIGAIIVTDLRDDKDGEAFIERGGIGSRSVTIGLKSPGILKGYKFQIEVYGINPRYTIILAGNTGR